MSLTPGRVTHVTAHYPPYVGGVENAVAAMATELARTYERVEVLTSNVFSDGPTDGSPAASAPGRSVEGGVIVRRYNTVNVGSTPVFLGLLVGLMRQPRGTVIHVHGPHAFLAEACRVVCRLRGMPLVVQVHLHVGRSTRLGVLLPAYQRMVVGPTLRAADRVVALTPELAEELEERYGLDPARLRVVPNAVSLADPGPGSPHPGDGPLRVLYLGRLVPQKRVSRLLDALDLCEMPFEAAVVGDGELRQPLEDQARDLGLDVNFVGPVDRDGVARWLQWADVFVLPSEREGMPLSVLEAMTAGVAVLATDVEGTRELVEGHGMLVETTAEALAAGLTQLARDPALRAELAALGKARATRDSWTSIADTLTKEYETMASPTGSSRPLDPTDASWASIEYTRTLWGIEPLDLDRMRAAYGAMLASSPQLAREVDTRLLTWRPLTQDELAAQPERGVLAGAAYATAKEADEAAFALDREGMPFRVVVGPNYLILRASHVFGDEWTAVTVLAHLAAQSRSDVTLELPWTEVTPRARRALTARQLVGHPRAVLAALRRRRELSGGPFEAARLNADRLTFSCTLVVSPEGFLTRMRAERAARGLDVSLAAVSLVGLRAAITEHLEAPVPGAEVVYDVRRESALTTRALGNWVAGLYVVADDDTDVQSVNRAIGAVRTSGLSLIAAAATRRSVRQVGDRGDRMVYAPEGGLRLTLSYIPGHGPLAQAPPIGPGGAYFGTNPPNGTNTLTLTCAEVGDQMHLGIEHYDDMWSHEQLLLVAETFFADPWAGRPSQPERTVVAGPR